MVTSSRFKFTATLVVSLVGAVLTLVAPYEADIGESASTTRSHSTSKR